MFEMPRLDIICIACDIPIENPDCSCTIVVWPQSRISSISLRLFEVTCFRDSIANVNGNILIGSEI